MFKILLSSSKPCLFVVLLYLGIFSTPQLMGQVVVQDGTGTCRVTVSTSTGVTVTYASGICTVKFTSIGADHLWTMPATGLQNVSFSIKGAGGGGGSSLPDGSYLQGAVFTGTVTQFNSSETYKIQVGSTTTTNLGGWPNGGLGGNNGTRGGGGATRLYDSGNNLILVAGGGGGHSGDSDPDGSTQGRDANGATGGLGGPGTESAGVAGSAAPN